MTSVDLFAIGSWTIYDHIARLSRYPNEGQTVTIDMPIEQLDATYFGDCSANVAAAAAKLGLTSGLGMIVGEDFIDSGYADHLTVLGVDLAGVEVQSGARSGHSYLYFDDAGDGFCLSHLGVAADQSTWRTPVSLLRNARAVVVNEMFSQYTLSGLEAAKEAGALTAINGMVGTAGSSAQSFIANADILFIAESELNDLLACLGLKNVDQLLRLGPKWIFVTIGSRGSVVYSADGQDAISIVPAKQIVDPTGAGDSYVAGVMAGLLKDMDTVKAGRVGAAVASFVVEQWGCQTNLPTWTDVMNRLEANQPQDAIS